MINVVSGLRFSKIKLFLLIGAEEIIKKKGQQVSLNLWPSFSY